MDIVIVSVLAATGGFAILFAIWCATEEFLLPKMHARRRASLPHPPVDAVAVLVEAKAEIRKDELRRWVEAWGRVEGSSEAGFWGTVQEIREIEYRAVREDRERRAAADAAQRRLEIEQRRTDELARIEADRRDRAARAEAERRQADEERTAAARHQAHLAERRRRYAEARRTR